MSMIKYVSPAGWDWDRPVVVPVKCSSRGLIGTDRADFVKSAGAAHVFLDVLDNIKVAKDEVPLHIIALGAMEAYGINRNGDGFPKSACEKYHPTFVKFARFFRNHKNKPEKGHPHFGIIKASAWNPQMQRVELLAVLNAEKSACDRNGGFVADIELEKLARDGDLPVSMACRVPFDVCTFCGNQAKSRDDYCTPGMCKAGGCKDNLTRVVKVAGDMHHLGVKNLFPTWFDMSRVFRQADRIASGAKANYFEKAAADGGVFDFKAAAELASQDTAPIQVIMYQDGLPGEWSTKIAAQIKLGYGMASCEAIEAQRSAEAYCGLEPQSPFDVDVLEKPGSEKGAADLGALADRKIILHIRDFGRWLGHGEGLVKAASEHLPGIYQRMIDDDSIERRIEQNKYPLAEKLASAAVRTAANLGAREYSLDVDAVRERAMLASIRGQKAPDVRSSFEKSAADEPEAEELARDYAIYKLAALQRIACSDSDFPLTARLSARQNHITL